ncbi:MAG: ROK family protein [Lachnospiraceae bacterium]|nr:ROK family protein [Lachnospiraceae bacterium]
MNIIALDIGGTAIKSCLFRNGELFDRREVLSEAYLGGPHVIKLAIDIIKDYNDFEAIAISTAGQVDSETGIISYANNNIPNYTGANLCQIFMEYFNVPVFVENDVYAAAIGEAIYGTGKGKHDFLCLTYGTGIGGAIVRGGSIDKGTTNAAGEFGRIITNADKYNDGISGYYEANASVSALISKVSAVRPELKDGRLVLANLDDKTVKDLVDKWINEVVYGLISLIYAFNPSLIILGGGIMSNNYVIGLIREKVSNCDMPGHSGVSLMAAGLGNDAGLWGMYHIARGICD